MAVKKIREEQKVFTGAQLLQAEKYKNRLDIVSAVIGEDEACTLEEVDRRIEKFLKGRVK